MNKTKCKVKLSTLVLIVSKRMFNSRESKADDTYLFAGDKFKVLSAFSQEIISLKRTSFLEIINIKETVLVFSDQCL